MDLYVILFAYSPNGRQEEFVSAVEGGTAWTSQEKARAFIRAKLEEIRAKELAERRTIDEDVEEVTDQDLRDMGYRWDPKSWSSLEFSFEVCEGAEPEPKFSWKVFRANSDVPLAPLQDTGLESKEKEQK